EREEDAQRACAQRHLPSVSVERVPGEPAGPAGSEPGRHAQREDQRAIQPVAKGFAPRVADVALDLAGREESVEHEDASGDDRGPGEGERNARTPPAGAV